MIRRFNEFSEKDPYSRRIALIGENHSMPELFGEPESAVAIQIEPNQIATHKAFSRLEGSDLIPKKVGSRFAAQSLKLPITVISPKSEIQTFQTKRRLNSADLLKGSHYFTRPNFTSRLQITTHDGKIVGAREIVDGKPVHIDLDRHPMKGHVKKAASQIHEALGASLNRFQLGLGLEGAVLLMMENFSLEKPELINMYFNTYESRIEPLPAWYKHKIHQTILKPYLSEYINREKLSKKLPYLL